MSSSGRSRIRARVAIATGLSSSNGVGSGGVTSTPTRSPCGPFAQTPSAASITSSAASSGGSLASRRRSRSSKKKPLNLFELWNSPTPTKKSGAVAASPANATGAHAQTSIAKKNNGRCAAGASARPHRDQNHNYENVRRRAGGGGGGGGGGGTNAPSPVRGKRLPGYMRSTEQSEQRKSRSRTLSSPTVADSRNRSKSSDTNKTSASGNSTSASTSSRSPEKKFQGVEAYFPPQTPPTSAAGISPRKQRHTSRARAQSKDLTEDSPKVTSAISTKSSETGSVVLVDVEEDDHSDGEAPGGAEHHAESRAESIDSDPIKRSIAFAEIGTVNDDDSAVSWQRGDLIGAGAFGKVFLGLNLQTGSLMAVKEVHYAKEHQQSIDELSKEINLMRSLSHTNIVRYLGSVRENAADCTILIFTEWVPGGSIEHSSTALGPSSAPWQRHTFARCSSGCSTFTEIASLIWMSSQQTAS